MVSLDVCRNRILSDDYRDLIVGWYEKSYLSSLITSDTCSQEITDLFRIVYLPAEVADPINLERYAFNNIPRMFGLIDMAALDAAGITAIQNYPTLQLKGEGVMIGFLDTGIDYQNSIFRNLDGTTRIIGLWDQTVQTGNVPEMFGYGSEYTEDQINQALQSDDPMSIVPSVDENGHGTFVASVAAGGMNTEQDFSGAAPECSIGVVKLKQTKPFWRNFYYINENAPCYEEPDVMLAIRYLNRLARRRNMPLVLCIALGSNQGGHTGRSPLSIMLENITRNDGRIVVTGAGNEADKRHHFLGQLTNETQTQTVEIQVADGVDGFSLELWTDVPNILSATVVSPSGEETPIEPITEGATIDYQFVFEQTKLNVDYRLYATGTQSQMILFRFGQPVQGIWKLNIRAEELSDGVFHMWLPMTEFLTNETVFLESNPDYTLTAPGTVSESMTVGYYNGQDGSLAISSGRGYNRAGEVKPNLVAPGVNVLGALPGGRYTTRTGSSISVAIASGASALLAQWSNFQLGESLDTLQARNLLVFGAIQQPGNEYPNNGWGYGQLNLFHTFEQLRRY